MFKSYRTIMIILLLFYIPVSSLTVSAQGNQTAVKQFSDVPKSSAAYQAIYDLRAMNITQGIGSNKFGYGKPMSRSEFVTILVKLMKWPLVKPAKGSFTDNQDKNKSYYPYIETAVLKGVIKKDSKTFRPQAYITREEMAVFLVRSMGYDTLALQPSMASNKPYGDVVANNGYITVACDFGLLSPKAKDLFAPRETVKKEAAAVSLMVMHKKLNSKLNELHAFYALQSSKQKELIKNLNSVSFGWSRLDYDPDSGKVILNMSSGFGNDMALPKGFSGPVDFARQNKVSVQLNIYATQETKIQDTASNKTVGLLDYVLTDTDKRTAIIDAIASRLENTEFDNESVTFDGVVIDFECMRGDLLRKNFILFLNELKEKLSPADKKLYVAVHPKRKAQAYYDAYDYKAIGKVADRIILMAHDYNAKVMTEKEVKMGYTTTPITPVDEVYYALKAITDKNTGVQDIRKIWLQISFGSAQWQTRNSVVINDNRKVYEPTYDKIRERVYNKDNMKDVKLQYSKNFENPFITYYNSKDNVYNKIWYEDRRSVQAKIDLAKNFGIQGISLWRLGTIPDFRSPDDKKIYFDVWQQIQNAVR